MRLRCNVAEMPPKAVAVSLRTWRWRACGRHRSACHRYLSLAQFVCTSICRGRASSRRGSVSFNTPFCRLAKIFDVSKSGLSENVRAKRDSRISACCSRKTTRCRHDRFGFDIKVAIVYPHVEFFLRDTR